MDPLRTYSPDARTKVMRAWANRAAEQATSADDPLTFPAYGLHYAADLDRRAAKATPRSWHQTEGPLTMRTLLIVVTVVLGLLSIAYAVQESPQQQRYRDRIALCSTWTCPAPSRPLLLKLHEHPDICVCAPPQEQGWTE